MGERKQWQLILVCWGTKYSVEDINRLHDAAKRNSPSHARTVLITDRDRPGLKPDIEAVDFPAVFLKPEFQKAGCQAKLAIFLKGVLQGDMPAVFCDLDSIVLGDLGDIVFQQRPTDIGILQSIVLPANSFVWLLYCVTGGRLYARGNSSIVAFHPKHHHGIADRFLELYAGNKLDFKPLTADERFISWSSQKHLCFIHRKKAVKFTREFMGRNLAEVRARAALPSTQIRRENLTFVTFNQDAIKPSLFSTFVDGQKIEDRKGRVTEWSEAALGTFKERVTRYFA